MELRFLDKGTKLTAECWTYNNELICEYSAIFYDMSGYITMIVECDDLFSAVLQNPNFNDEYYLKIIFFRGASFYSFKGKIKNTVLERTERFVLINQISDIVASARRTYPRLEITIRANLYSMVHTPLILGDTLDISAEGLCLLSNTELAADVNSGILEFTLKGNAKFILPAKLVRRGNSPQLSQYKFDYGFLFDYDSCPEEKSRLITALFMHKMKDL